jgi:hypothetical protein
MPVGRDDAPRERMRARPERMGEVEGEHGFFEQARAKRCGGAIGVDQPDHQRRNRLVESEDEARGRITKYRAVRRVAANESGVGERGGRSDSERA